MKHKILLVLFSAILFFSLHASNIYAVNEANYFALQQQIQAVQEKIKYLQSLIASSQLQNEVESGSYLVMDLSNNSIVSQKNINQTYPIASITKLMNAVIVSENVDFNQTITLTKDMLSPGGYSPSLFLHLRVSVKNLLWASLIQSTNDAAQSLTYSIGNEQFIKLMNQKANDLGMQNTFFYDAHGLNPQNHSTATDLAKLITYIYKSHPNILHITKDNDFWLPDSTGKLLKFKNVNNFYKSPDFIGGKTGYLPEAKQSMAAIFNVNGKPMAIVVLYSKNRQTDILKIIDWVKACNI